MARIIVNVTNLEAAKNIRRWINGNRRSINGESYVQKYFIRQLGPRTFMMKSNGAALALLYDLKLRYGDSIRIYIAESLEIEDDFPKEIVKVVKKCRNKKLNLLREDLGSLENIEIYCSVNWSPR